MNGRPHVRFWLFVAAAFIGFLWLFQPILLPFLIGFAVAYLLDPVVAQFDRIGVPRWLSATIVLAVFALAVALIGLLVFPLLQQQILNLIDEMPHYVAWGQERAAALLEFAEARLSPEDVQKLRDQLGSHVGEAISLAGRALSSLVGGGLAVFNVVSVVVVTPIVAFYMLRDWNKLTGTIDGWLPRRYAPVIRAQASKVNDTLSGFVRGQATVCLILATYYGVGLSFAGLKFGLTIGIVAGLVAFIPYVGSAFGLLASVGVALIQFDNITDVVIVAAVFGLGQLVEGHVLTPVLVGDRVGLHPLWVIFALFAGALLAGFTGMLLAIPAAAVIGVVARFMLARYLESPMYLTGTAPPPPRVEPMGPVPLREPQETVRGAELAGGFGIAPVPESVGDPESSGDPESAGNRETVRDREP